MTDKTSAKKMQERAAAEETQLHRDFAAWIEEKTGQQVDMKSVQLACIFRMEFQRSDENQEALKERKAKAEAEKKKRAAAKKARLEAQLKKLQAELSDEPAQDEPVKAAELGSAEPAQPVKAASPKRAPRARTSQRKKTAA